MSETLWVWKQPPGPPAHVSRIHPIGNPDELYVRVNGDEWVAECDYDADGSNWGSDWEEILYDYASDGWIEAEKTEYEKALELLRKLGGISARPTKAVVEAANLVIRAAMAA